MVSQPQFLLFCDTHTSQPASPLPNHGLGNQAQALGDQPQAKALGGRWHFVLDRLDCPQRLEATDAESAIHPDRLALLSVVRGLEALDEPSQVNLVTTSRYVSRGLKYGLATWRASDYRWEHFGIQRPVRNADLWQRVDRAMRFHGVTCRLLQAQAAAVAAATADAQSAQVASESSANDWDGADWEGPSETVLPNRTASPVAASPVAASPVAASTLALVDPTLNSLRSPGCEMNHIRPQPSQRVASLNRVSGLIQPAETGLVTSSEQALHSNFALSSWCSVLVSWWEMALTWLKWRRRRNQARPAIFGV